MKNILDEPDFKQAPQPHYVEIALNSIIVLLMTVPFVVSDSFLFGSNWDVLDVAILMLHAVSTLAALVTSILALSHQEPKTGSSVFCLMLSGLVVLIWLFVLAS